MLKSIRIGPKLYGGFGVVLALLIIIGVVAIIQLNSIGTTFGEYRGLARAANEIGRVQANMLQTRMGVKDFIIRGDQASMDTVLDRAAKAQEFIGTTKALVDTPDYEALLDEMLGEVNSYTEALRQGHRLSGPARQTERSFPGNRSDH